MKNEIIEKNFKNIFSGVYPPVVYNQKIKTPVEEGDIIGISSTNEYGKYDGSTYTDCYGIAYEGCSAEDEATIIVSGELSKEFIKFPTGKENELINNLKNISIFIK